MGQILWGKNRQEKVISEADIRAENGKAIASILAIEFYANEVLVLIRII